MKLPKELKAAILNQARAEIPYECCGLIASNQGNIQYFPCKNLSTEPKESFALGGYDRVEDENDEILALVHSHPGHSIEFSPLDISACEESGVPWIVVDPISESWGYLDPFLTLHKIEVT